MLGLSHYLSSYNLSAYVQILANSYSGEHPPQYLRACVKTWFRLYVLENNSKEITTCTPYIHRSCGDICDCRRKFRSQTSDIMDRWKSRGGKGRGGEEPKREDQRRERLRRKKKKVCEKVGKSRFILFFQ